MRVLNKALPSPIPDPALKNLLRPNYRGFASRLAVLPLRVVAVARQLATNIGEISMMDLVMGIAEGLPTGIYNNRGLERYMTEVLSDPDRSNDFRELDAELLITATDVDTCERLVLGQRRVGGRPDLQGGRRLDRAADRLRAVRAAGPPADGRRDRLDHQRRRRGCRGGAKFIVVVNPLVPYVNDFEKRIPTLFGSRVRRVGGHGHAGDRQPGLPPDGPRPPAARGRVLEAPLPGRRHHPDRTRARRRADVRHLDPRLLVAAGDRQARLRVGHRTISPATTSATRRSPPATGSRSPPAGCARSSTRSRRRRRGSPPGAGCSSRPPAPCCASPTRPRRPSHAGELGGSRVAPEAIRSADASISEVVPASLTVTSAVPPSSSLPGS